MGMTDAHRCYAYRYPDLLRGFCKGKIQQCDAGELSRHYEQFGQDEGRHFSCKTQDVQCYALRYPDILRSYCQGDSPPSCSSLEVLKHYGETGFSEGKTLACRAADSECYVLRYPDLLQGYCGGAVSGCDWFS